MPLCRQTSAVGLLGVRLDTQYDVFHLQFVSRPSRRQERHVLTLDPKGGIPPNRCFRGHLNPPQMGKIQY